MINLFSKVPPVSLPTKGVLIVDAIKRAMTLADKVEIAVGYASAAGLIQLDKMVRENKITSVKLVLGMYRTTGIPESIYNQATLINEQWKKKTIGSVYFVNNMNYHGKSYVFFKNGKPFGAVVGSANLSVLAPEGPTIRQYEMAVYNDSVQECKELSHHINDVIKTSADNASNLKNFNITHERIDVLRGIENIIEITPNEVQMYHKRNIKTQVRIPIKAPKYADRFSDKSTSFAHSNINVCYGKGRENKKSGKIVRRNWYEAQITVSKDITALPYYPKGDPFYLVTDDGYKFLAHSTAQNDKQLTAYGHSGNDRVFGRWIKGRLATAGYVKPYDDVDDDINGDGIVTLEMLTKAHMSVMVLTKTDTQEYGEVYLRHAPTKKNKKGALDKNHTEKKLLDVWTVHFEDLEDGEE